MTNEYRITTDGGSRGNPGPAGIGFSIHGPGMAALAIGEYIGETTNNIAEYTAAIKALAKLKALLGSEKAAVATVLVQADSELLVRQANGQYKVKNAALKGLFVQLFNARQDFASVRFEHIPREKNFLADSMVNEALDKHLAAVHR